MTVAWVLIVFACQLAPGAAMTRAACTWSAVEKPFQSFAACQADGAGRLARAEDLRPANWVWILCLPRDDLVAGEGA